MKSKPFIIMLLIIFLFQQKIILGQSTDIMDSTMDLSVLQKGLENYLNKIPVGKESDFGFNSKEEFNEIVFGNPIQIYSMSEDLSTGINFLPIKKWKVPLIIDDSYRCFLDISFKNGGYKVVGIGLNELASDLDNYERQRNLKEIKNKAIFIDYSLRAYFLVIKDENNSIEFFPFRPFTYCNLDGNSNKDKYSSNEIFEILKTINKNLKNEH